MKLLKKLAAVLFYSAVPLFIPLLYSIITGDSGWIPIGITMAILMFPAVPELILGLLTNITNLIQALVQENRPFNYAKILNLAEMKKEVETLTLGEILALTAIAWILVPLLTIFPYIYYGVPVFDAVFESMSAWTSTGLSALPTVSVLPSSVILFRSTAQWVGGLGIVILILIVFRGKEALGFLKAEGRAMPDVGIGETVRLTFDIYLVLTILGIVMLLALDMDFFNSINLTFSGLSNGGFYPFDSYPLTDAQQLALAALMFAGATSFLFYKYISEAKFKKAIFDEEFLTYLIVTSLAICTMIWIGKEEILNATLNTISAIACGGFAIGNLAALHDFAKYLLILLMLSGAMIGSTTGGVKLWRILAILKAIVTQIKAAFLPKGSVQITKINNMPINDRAMTESATFMFTYLLIFLAAGGAFIAANYGTEDALFLVASAMGNVGLSTVYIPAVGVAGKGLLIILMYLGRIEVFPSLVLIGYILRR